MGLFERIRRTFNIGGARLAIRLAEPCFPQGAPVAGEVLIGAGEYRQEAHALRVTLVERWRESRGSGKNRRRVTVTRTRDEAVLAAPCAIEPGAEHAFPFTLRLPANCRLGGGDEGWRLDAALEVPGAIDPGAHIEVDVVPGVEIARLEAAITGHLGFTGPADACRWKADGARGALAGAVLLRFLPPAGLGGSLDEIRLACATTGDGGLRVALTADLQEQGLVDHLKAMVGMDDRHGTLLIPPGDLHGDDAGQARIAAAVAEALRTLLPPERSGG